MIYSKRRIRKTLNTKVMDYWNIYQSGAFRVSLVLILLCNAFITLYIIVFKFHRQFDLVTSASASEDEVLSCFLQLRPVTDEILSLDLEQFQSHQKNKKAGPLQCLQKNLPKFIIDYESNLIRSNPLSNFWSGSECFYKILEADVIRRKVFTITQEITKIPSNTEHIFIWCTKKSKAGKNRTTIYEDYVSQVPVKQDVEEDLKDKPASLHPQNYPSVFIMGIDSSSHMNFRRYMPKVHEFLVQEMAALEFHGLNSIGPKTVFNSWPLLSGHHYEDLKSMCATSRGRGQLCRKIWPIWKTYHRVGYRTSFCQDDVIGAIFADLGAPTFFHYNLFKITKRLDNLSRRRQGKIEEKRGCYGSTLTFDLLLDNFLKTALTFSKLNKPVWHLSWLSELTHDVNYHSKYGQPRLLQALKQLHVNQTLNNSVFFLLSDHGMRFGPMREQTKQGFLEERLPFLYVVLPENFKARFSNAYSNMKGNSHKLITMFDVHATLAHLSSLTGSGGEGDLILGGTGKGSGFEEGKAVSLFKRISGKRSCETVGIPPTYCACARKSNISADTPLIQEITDAVVEEINLKLSSHPQCHQLTLSGVTMASRIHYSRNATGSIYEISFLTTPGNASFYASVSQTPTNNSTTQVLNIERISAYGGHVPCISGNGKELRAFCQCKPTQHNLPTFQNSSDEY